MKQKLRKNVKYVSKYISLVTTSANKILGSWVSWWWRNEAGE